MSKGHDVFVVTLNGWGQSYKNETYEGLEICTVPSLSFPKIEYLVPDMIGLTRLISKIGDDFEIHHYFQQEYLTIVPTFLFKAPVKVLTVDNFPGLDWSYGKRVVDMLARFESLTVGRMALKRSDGIIFLSKLSMKTALNLEPSVASRSIWIPDGVDTNRIKPNQGLRRKIREELDIDGVAIAFIGRLAPVKGIAYLAEAIKKLDREGFEGNFIIVGDGPEKSRLENLRLSNSKIHLLGFKRDPIRYIQAADMLVLPSLGEGCPNAILEAFACGKPAIASNVGGVPDLIQNNVNGVIVQTKNSVKLAKAIRVMASVPKRLKIMGMRARQFAERELDWVVVTERVLQFYSMLSGW